VYELNHHSLNWARVGNTISGNAEFEESGFSVSLNGNGTKIAISSPGYSLLSKDSSALSKNGQIRVFRYMKERGIWSKLEFSTILGSNNDMLGQVVSLSGDGNVLAASSAKSRKVFIKGVGKRNVADFAVIEQNISVENFDDHDIDLSYCGTFLLVGAPGNVNNGTNSIENLYGTSFLYNVTALKMSRSTYSHA